MKLLLDTQSFLWFIMGSPKLSFQAKTLIRDPNNDRYLSMASIWEMAMKMSLGKLKMAQSFAAIIPHQLQINGIEVLNISLDHILMVATLPFHHRDPFDRLIIAQALVEQLPVVGQDPMFDHYLIQRLW
jgi:PIN domain nuclease of toxin-antitoxin system